MAYPQSDTRAYSGLLLLSGSAILLGVAGFETSGIPRRPGIAKNTQCPHIIPA